MVGQTVGKYRVISRLGRGGMGTVYKAIDETLEREVAIKRLNPDLTEHEVLKRFRAEAITLARLNHPNIATLFELTQLDGEFLMVMEFVRGETFEALCERLGAIPIPRAIELCSQVFDALSHAHRAGIVHRDLKPANLMLAESGVVKVMDFGLARMAGSEHLTNDGYMVGTPAYMSPEQVLGGEVDGRADLYAMAVVLYRLLSGQLPFKASSGIEMAHRQMYDQPTPVRQLRTELPAIVETILLRALAKDPADRYQTADAFRAALAPLAGAALSMDSARALSGFASADITRTVVRPAPDPAMNFQGDMPTISAISPARQPSAVSLPHDAAADEPATPPVVSPSSTPATFAPPVGAAAVVTSPPAKPAVAAKAHTKRVPVAVASVLAVLLLVALPLGIYVWRARSVPSAALPPPLPAAAPVAPPVTPVPADSGSTAPALDVAVPPAPPPVAATPREAAGRVNSASASASAGKRGAAPATGTSVPPVPAEPAKSEAPAVPPPSATLPVLTFTQMKLLVTDGGKARDRDASLRLDAEGLHVMDGATPVQFAAYGDVIGIYQSHSREPRWTTPDGTAVAVAKTSGGKFSFFKGVPDWVTVRTKEGFIPLRIDESDLARVIAALEARTGTKIVRAR